MSESEPESDREDPRYDAWPIERDRDTEAFDEHARENEDAVDEVDREPREDVKWIGTIQDHGNAWVYDSGSSTLHAAEVDEENERAVLQEGSRREIESDESLGERIEQLGEEHDWEWLSSFARKHLEGGGREPDEEGRAPDDEEARADAPGDLALRGAEFDRRNVAADADHDFAYTARRTFEDSTGRVHVLEHWFYVRDGGDRATVDVREDFLVAEEPREEDSAGDAESVEQREHEFTVELDPDRADREVRLREELEEWHEAHVDWPGTGG